MTWHYDLRMVCEKTGELESTESMGMTFNRAIRDLLWAEREYPGTYRLVSCDRPASDRCHDTDLSHHIHMNGHEGYEDWTYQGYLGSPTDALFPLDGGPEYDLWLKP